VFYLNVIKVDLDIAYTCISLGKFLPKTENRTEPNQNVGFSVFRFGFGFGIWEFRCLARCSALPSNRTEEPFNRTTAVLHQSDSPCAGASPTVAQESNKAQQQE
jgi:hypothetical protein